MTKMLRRLEAMELVTRVNDPKDRRSKLVRLTAAGKKMEKEAFEAFLANTHKLLQSASRKDLATIDDAIRRLLGIIERHYYR
jgi:DNA-binding MarR family transcriptional regulator